MRGPVHRHLTEDHERLEGHLARAVADPGRVDLDEGYRVRHFLYPHP
jgi:hypothetical protein